MAGRSAVLAIKIVSDARKAASDMDKMSESTGKFDKVMSKARTTSKGVLTGIGLIGAASLAQASALQQSTGAVDAVFGKASSTVKQLAKDAAQSAGLATSEYQDLAAVLGAQLGNMGVAQGKLAATTDGLIKTGADLAAQFGGSSKEAVEALSSALKGETDPIEKYGISIKQSTIAAELAARGQDKLTGKALEAAKTQVLLSLVSKQGATAMGAFGREANTAAGQQARAAAEAKNAAAALGTVLLPVVASVSKKAAELAGFIADNAKAFQILAGVAGVLAVVVLAVGTAQRVAAAATVLWSAATKAMAAAQWVLNAALAANPIGLIIIAVIALIAGLVLLYKKSAAFRTIVNAVGKAAAAAFGWVVAKVTELVGWVAQRLPAAFALAKTLIVGYLNLVTFPFRTLLDVIKAVVGFVRDKAPGAFSVFKTLVVGYVNAVLAPFRALWDLIQDIIGAIKNIKLPSLPDLNPLNRGIPGRTTFAGATSGGGGDTFVFNVNGFAGDRDQLVATLKREFARSDRRAGK